jgi:hypothetical protein
MSCSSLTSCQHGHVRTLSSTDKHVFARLRVDPRSCMLCCSPDRCQHTFYVSRMPSQCCVLSYKAVPFLHSARATPTVASQLPRASDPGAAPRAPPPLAEPAESPLPGAAARGARAGAPCATCCGCPRQSPRRKPRHHSRVRDCRLERPGTPPRRAGPGLRLHARRDRAVMRQGPSPKSVISQRSNGNRPARGRIRLWPRCCTRLLFPELGCVLGTGAAGARAILTTDNALARPTVTLATRLATAEALIECLNTQTRRGRSRVISTAHRRAAREEAAGSCDACLRQPPQQMALAKARHGEAA